MLLCNRTVQVSDTRMLHSEHMIVSKIFSLQHPSSGKSFTPSNGRVMPCGARRFEH